MILTKITKQEFSKNDLMRAMPILISGIPITIRRASSIHESCDPYPDIDYNQTLNLQFYNCSFDNCKFFDATIHVVRTGIIFILTKGNPHLFTTLENWFNLKS